MSKQKRRSYTAEQKAAIVRRYLVDKTPVSQLCEEYTIQPSVFYAWHKQLVESLEGIFTDGRGSPRAKSKESVELERERKRVAALEARLARKDAVIAEISEQLIAEKKSNGEN
jgi:transposase-like protein